MEIELVKRTEKESVAYIMGLYFTGRLSLAMLKIQIQSLEESTGTEGQDRENYTDNQDRENYTGEENENSI